MKKKLFVLILLILPNIMFAYDKLFDFKLELQEQFKPTAKWKYLTIDKNFSLDKNNPNAILGKMVVCLALFNDKFYIVDNNRHKIVIFNKKGKFVKRYGRIGKGPGDLEWPYWITNYKNMLIVKNYSSLDFFDRDLKFVKRIRTFLHYFKFSIKDNNIYIANINLYKNKYPLIIKTDLSGRVVKCYYEGKVDKKNIFGFNSIFHIRNKHYYIPAHWNALYEFNDKLDLTYKGRIKYIMLDKFKKWDKIAPIKPNFNWPSNMIKSVKVYKRRIFVLLNMPRLEILEIDTRGNVLNHYYNNIFFKYMRWSDFVIEKEKDNLVFYVMGKSIGKEIEDEKLESNVYKVYVKDDKKE